MSTTSASLPKDAFLPSQPPLSLPSPHPQRVQAVLSDSEQVTLNVGGYRFTTTVHTLRNAPAPSLFAAMFSGRHTVTKDASGCYFIDRDGRHFHDILN